MPSTSLTVRGRRSLAHSLVTTALAAVGCTLVPMAAHAQSARVETACKKDYYKFCPQYSVGTPELRSCMGQAGKRGSLTPKCLNALIDEGYVPRKYLKR